MKIDTFVLAHQEEKMIGYFMRHYSLFSQVYLMEGHSTDRTVEIAKSYGAIRIPVDSQNEVNDEIWTSLKNNCWKQSTADWVIVCDTDEFVVHPEGITHLLQFLNNTDATVLLPRLFNMFSGNFPITNGQIYEEVKHGREGGAKMNVFRPSQIKEINYRVGCHHAEPTGNVKLDINSPLITLHMRHLSEEYVIARNHYLSSRLSDINKKMGWGFHVSATDDEVCTYMRNEMTSLIKVI